MKIIYSYSNVQYTMLVRNHLLIMLLYYWCEKNVFFLCSWTIADFETACRELGLQGGRWSTWMDRQWPARPRLLYEQPQCRGTESSLQNCDQWSNRQLGAGVCGNCIGCLVFSCATDDYRNVVST